MDISDDDAKQLAEMAEKMAGALAYKIRTAKRLPVVDVGECVIDGKKIIVSLSATGPASSFDDLTRYGYDDARP